MSIPGIGRVLKDAGIEHTLTPGWRDRIWVRLDEEGRPYNFDWTDIRAVTVHTTESDPAAFRRGEDAPTLGWVINGQGYHLSLIHISEPTRRTERSRMPSSA